MTDGRFGDLTEVYESIVNWPKRLANEEPLYRRLLERLDARSVVDVACGTGHHAALFHRWGLRVEAADISPEMIQRARGRFGEPPGLRWIVRRFDQPADSDGQFDVAICVGNSLALATDMETVERAIRCMLGAVRTGGAILVQLLNLWRLPDGPCVWQKHCYAELTSGRVIIVKGVHRSGTRGFVDLLVTPDEGVHEAYGESVPLLGIEAETLHDIASAAGAESIELLGGYQSQRYRREESVDLIMRAKKG
jgi:SAM-dependent methyltransferase